MTDIQKKIGEILGERLPGTDFESAADKKIVSIGMDSIQMMLFSKSIQDSFNVQVPFPVYFGSTVGELADYIAANTASETAVSDDTAIPEETDEMTDLQYSYWIGSQTVISEDFFPTYILRLR